MNNVKNIHYLGRVERAIQNIHTFIKLIWQI